MYLYTVYKFGQNELSQRISSNKEFLYFWIELLLKCPILDHISETKFVNRPKSHKSVELGNEAGSNSDNDDMEDNEANVIRISKFCRNTHKFFK